MNTILLFEDHEKTPSSCLLLYSVNSSNIKFSEGDGLLFKRVTELKNNKYTVDKYRRLITRIREEHYENIIVYSIICIEVYVVGMLSKYGYLVHAKKSKNLYDCLYGVFDWFGLPDSKTRISLEQVYKQILSEQRLFCMQNQNKEKNAVFGSFYKINCSDCRNRVCNVSRLDELEIKANRLYTMLPVFAADD